jgi:hypothetical protein
VPRNDARPTCTLGVTAAGVAVLLLGCGEPLPEPYWEGEHIILAAEEPERVCGGTAEYMDRRAGELFEKLGTDPVKVEYYLLNDIDEYCSHDDFASGCAVGSRVYVERVPLFHEIVHTRANDGMPTGLEEGLATYLGDPHPTFRMASRERMAELLTQDIDYLETSADYGRAAHFIAFLDEQFGWDSVRMLDTMLTAESRPVDIDATFEAVFGGGIEAVLDLYAKYPECTGKVDSSIACAAPATPGGFPSAVWEHRVDCAATNAIGPDHDMAFVEQVIELGPAIALDRIVGITGDAVDRGAFVVLQRCGLCSEEGGLGRIHGRGPHFISETELPAGRYVARFYLPIASAPATVGLRVDG